MATIAILKGMTFKLFCESYALRGSHKTAVIYPDTQHYKTQNGLLDAERIIDFTCLDRRSLHAHGNSLL